MAIKVAMQKARWDIMHQKFITPEFVSWLEGEVPGIRVEPVSDEEILGGALVGFDAVFYPGSVGSMLAVEMFGDMYRSIVREFVHSGGRYIGVCGGCYAAVSRTPIWSAIGLAARSAYRDAGTLKGALEDIKAFDPEIGAGIRPMAGKQMAGMLLRGRARTFGLLEGVTCMPRFMGDPDFVRNRWAKMVTEGRLLEVRLRVSNRTHPPISGHEGELLDCAYSGGPMMYNLGPAVRTLLRYESSETLPEARGKVAVAYCHHGDGLVMVSGPDCYLPLQTGPGMSVIEGMKPSIEWLTRNLFTGTVDRFF